MEPKEFINKLNIIAANDPFIVFQVIDLRSAERKEYDKKRAKRRPFGTYKTFTAKKLELNLEEVIQFQETKTLPIAQTGGRGPAKNKQTESDD